LLRRLTQCIAVCAVEWDLTALCRDDLARLAHRTITALRPCFDNSSLLSFAALALPPFLPSATAWGFFLVPISEVYYVTARKTSLLNATYGRKVVLGTGSTFKHTKLGFAVYSVLPCS
jgi:hypothetical protein